MELGGLKSQWLHLGRMEHIEFGVLGRLIGKIRIVKSTDLTLKIVKNFCSHKCNVIRISFSPLQIPGKVHLSTGFARILTSEGVEKASLPYLITRVIPHSSNKQVPRELPTYMSASPVWPVCNR